LRFVLLGPAFPPLRAVAVWAFRPRSQRRDRGGFAPPSLFPASYSVVGDYYTTVRPHVKSDFRTPWRRANCRARRGDRLSVAFGRCLSPYPLSLFPFPVFDVSLIFVFVDKFLEGLFGAFWRDFLTQVIHKTALARVPRGACRRDVKLGKTILVSIWTVLYSIRHELDGK